MEKDIIEYKDLLEAEAELLGFGEVTFKKDFGPWKKGQVITSWWIHLSESRVSEEDTDGNLIAECKFELTPVV